METKRQRDNTTADERKRRFDTTHQIAMDTIEREALERREKSARLRKARLSGADPTRSLNSDHS